MKLKSKWMLIPVLGLALGTAWAVGLGEDQGEPAGPPEKRGWSGQPGEKDELGLTEEQKTKLRALHMDGRKAGIRSRADLQLRQLELQELMEAENPDRAAIDKKLRELSDARHAQMKQRIDQQLTFHGILTPEQRTKLRTMRQRLHRRMAARQFMRQRGQGFDRGFGRGMGRGFGRGFGPERRPGRGPGFGPGAGGDFEDDWDEEMELEPPIED